MERKKTAAVRACDYSQRMDLLRRMEVVHRVLLLLFVCLLLLLLLLLLGRWENGGASTACVVLCCRVVSFSCIANCVPFPILSLLSNPTADLGALLYASSSRSCKIGFSRQWPTRSR